MSETPHTDRQHRAILQGIAQRAMIERGLLPTFSDAASAELRDLHAAAPPGDAAGVPGIRDLTGLTWASIDNDDSRDLDQLTVAEPQLADAVKIRVAVADVDALVKDGSAIDAHARHSTTSVYTAVERSAIGAAVGAGGGAGTVIVRGRDQLDFERGTELTIISTRASRPTSR